MTVSLFNSMEMMDQTMGVRPFIHLSLPADPKSKIRCLLAKNQYDCINLSLSMQIK